MDRTEFIGKLNMIYVGDNNAIDDITAEFDRLNNIVNELEKKLLELRLTDVDGKTIVYRLLDKLQELKGDGK